MENIKAKVSIIFYSLCFLPSLALGVGPSFPSLFFSYGWDHDSQYCPSSITNTQWVTEAFSRVDEFQQAWDQEGKLLLGGAVTSVGKPFLRKEETATLTLCRDKPTIAHPLTISYWPFLVSTKFPEQPISKLAFINIVFHEVLHGYVSELLGGKPSTNFTYSSPLTDIFKADWLVAGHLHLMAIQTLVYTNLGRPDLVQANLAFVMAQVPVPPQTASPYVTAWRIVNDPTFPQYIGVDPFIHELVISK